MALARVVQFDDVSPDRMAQLKSQVESGERPEGLPATEMVLLHDAENGKALAVIFFDNEEDYRQGDATLSAMPADEVPGTRASVTKYDVAVRATD
jgi:hypothetical protein